MHRHVPKLKANAAAHLHGAAHHHHMQHGSHRHHRGAGDHNMSDSDIEYSESSDDDLSQHLEEALDQEQFALLQV